MAPLAKQPNHDVENCASSVQMGVSAQLAPPASAWSCATPTAKNMFPSSMMDSLSSLSGSSHITSSTGSSHSAGSSLSGSGRDSLTVLHNVGGAFRVMFLVLERNGVARGSIREMQEMILNEQYLEAMERAEEYVDCLVSTGLADLDSIHLLFVNAWETLHDYSKTVFKEAQKEYSHWENKHWMESIENTNMSEYEQERRRQRRLQNYDPEEQGELKHKLFLATRFKIDSGKGLVQTTEWGRYLRAHNENCESSN